MGKIKGKLVKKTAKSLTREGIPFTSEFERNKKVLGKTMPSKKIRNQIAGYLSRMNKFKLKQ